MRHPISTLLLLATLSACNSGSVSLERGNALYSRGKYQEAALVFRRILKSHPAAGEAHYRLALAELKLGRAAAAGNSFRRSILYLPKYEPAKVGLADLLVSSYLNSPASPEGRAALQEASRLAGQALAANPSSFDGTRLQGHIALAEKRTAEAVRLLRQCNGARPGQPQVTIPLADALFQSGANQEAESLALEA